MREDNFIVVHGWMISRLNLSGSNLLLYALLYSFSKTPADPGFEGWPKDLRSFCNGLMPSSSYYDAKQLLEKRGLIRYQGRHIRAVVPDSVPRELLIDPQNRMTPAMTLAAAKRSPNGSTEGSADASSSAKAENRPIRPGNSRTEAPTDTSASADAVAAADEYLRRRYPEHDLSELTVEEKVFLAEYERIAEAHRRGKGGQSVFRTDVPRGKY